jgi:hypothetical protein
MRIYIQGPLQDIERRDGERFVEDQRGQPFEDTRRHVTRLGQNIWKRKSYTLSLKL